MLGKKNRAPRLRGNDTAVGPSTAPTPAVFRVIPKRASPAPFGIVLNNLPRPGQKKVTKIVSAID
jgi:hypothetical protein